jgi:hypothetical protein
MCDALLDALQLQAGTTQIRFSRRALQRRAIAHALEFEIELDPILPQGTDAPVYRLSTHRWNPIMSIKMWPSGARLQSFPSGQSPRSILRSIAFTE